jgi:hypothetical protein
MSESKELSVVERAVKALSSVANEKVLQDLVAQSATITAIKNADGRTQCHSAYMVLKNRRTAITAVGKESREDATKFSQAVIAEEKRLVAITEKEELRLKALRDDYDAEVEAARIALVNAEAERVAAISRKINELRSLPVDFHNRSADEIKIALDDLESFEATEAEFAELVNEAHSVKIDTIEALKKLYATAVYRAEEAQKLADERAELARLRAEQEERDRVAAVARDEQEAKDREAREAHEKKLADAFAEVKRQQAQINAEQQSRQKEIDDAQAIAQAEIARQQAALDAERQRIADEAAERQRAEEAETAAKAQAEADRIFAEHSARAAAERAAEQARAAADTAMRNAAQAMFDALERMLDCFVDDPLSYQYSSGPVIEAARDAIALARPVETEAA